MKVKKTVSAAKVWKQNIQQDVYASKTFYTNQENVKLSKHSLGNWKKIIHQSFLVKIMLLNF